MLDPLPLRVNTPHKTIPTQTQRRLPVDLDQRFPNTGWASAAGILASLTPQRAEGRGGCRT